jgi:phage baseplate assembly protein W
MPQSSAKARLAQEVFVAIRTHEPRARIKGAIRFVETPEEAMDGYIIPQVTIEVIL